MTMSIAEAKYIACSIVVKEAIWLKYFLGDLKLINNDGLIPIFIDSTLAISMVKSP